jgi:acetylornithine deacetylase/succinyl-diaminopimelate desuccinylase-like protein
MTQGMRQHVWDASAIQRAMRLLSAHSPNIHDPQATAKAIRLLWDILHRRGMRPEIFQIPGIMPLLLVGDGPTLFITYIDDNHPGTSSGDTVDVDIVGDVATGPGVTRRAGALAVVSALAAGDLDPDKVTLIIESDRHTGSRALEVWLESSSRELDSALWETSDLPVPTPAVFRSATGLLTLRITVRPDVGHVENHFAGVLPDAGQLLATILSDLKSRDAEVLVPGFYEGVDAPDAEGLELMQAIAPAMHAWVMRGTLHDQASLSPEHLTLGAFCAPSVSIRSIELPDAWPCIARSARAVIEARLLPGQNARALVRSITDFIHVRVPSAQVETLMIRPPAPPSSFDFDAIADYAFVYPVAPGASPAGLLDSLGIPTIGFATVTRQADAAHEAVTVSTVVNSARFIADVAHRLTVRKRATR